MSTDGITFGRLGDALDFYYLIFSGGYGAIDYEKIKVDRSLTDTSMLMDAYCTIGYYLARLGEEKKHLLTFFYRDGHKDHETALRMNDLFGNGAYNADRVKAKRHAANRSLENRFVRIGLIHTIA